jgi:hypothetical protein
MANKMALAFDRKTGRIVHAHHFFALNPADEKYSSDIETLVMRDVAAMPSLASLEIEVLVVDGPEDGPAKAYEVAVTSGYLIRSDGEEGGFKTGAGFRRP